MKKYIPYIANLLIAFIGIILTYYLFNNTNIYEDHEIIVFLIISFVFVFALDIIYDTPLKHWLLSLPIFYLTVLVLFLIGEQWGLNTANIFTPFQIKHHSINHQDSLPHLLEFNYPTGILLLTILNLIVQFAAAKFSKLMKIINAK